jgi:DNA-directed RNA polymerase specialized sigma24 family protein
VLAIKNAPVELRSDPEKMSYLADLGFATDDIAAILQVAVKTVQNRLGELRKANPAKR